MLSSEQTYHLNFGNVQPPDFLVAHLRRTNYELFNSTSSTGTYARYAGTKYFYRPCVTTRFSDLGFTIHLPFKISQYDYEHILGICQNIAMFSSVRSPN